VEPVPGRSEIADAARKLVAAALRELTEQRVIPTSLYHPFIQAGRDYEGPSVMELPQFKAVERQLEAAYPDRFGEPLRRKHPEFANIYLLRFIEGCVRRCSDEEAFVADTQGVSASIDELLDLLDASSHTMAAVRAMSHIHTQGSSVLTLNDVEVIPEPPGTNFDFFLDACRSKIPGSGASFNRERPFVFAHPHAVLAAHASTEGTDAFEATKAASSQINRFVLALRLLTGTTARAHFEVRGPTTLVGPIQPELLHYRRANGMMPMVRRTATLRVEDEHPIRELGVLLDSAEVKRDKMAATSFDVAIGRFNASFSDDGILTLVDLATALEAAFIDEADGTEGITTRLRSRAAALLATNDDPSANIFNDVGAFYDLRSTLVHGGNLTEARLRKKILGISTITEKDMFGISAAQAVDRMRDLVRRAILARLCLASGSEPLWPFNPKSGMDVAFADDARRREMREAWQDALARIGASLAARHLPAPGDILREDFGSNARTTTDAAGQQVQAAGSHTDLDGA
jgi:hypothetical protein